MVRFLPALLALALASGCASRTVRVEVVAAPAVQLRTSKVAVVTGDRECRPQANALIDALGRRASIEVDPRADVRVTVFGCGLDVGWDLVETVDATGDRPVRSQSAEITGRGHAAVAISSTEGTMAHLVGNARQEHLGGWGVEDMFRNRRVMRQRLITEVAHDLVAQLDPDSRELDRRVYPRASEGSARDLHNLAVRAEQRGDLHEAIRLARAALSQRPTSRDATYLRDLERRINAPSPSSD